MPIVKCPIHQYIELSPLEKDIVDTKIFQRLRGIKQNALAIYTYPTALSTRFDHSLGVMHVGGRIIERVLISKNPLTKEFLDKTIALFYNGLEVRSMEVRSTIIQAVRLACLLHDIGHFPFSHSIEKIVSENLETFYSTAFINEYKEAKERGFSLHEFISYKITYEDEEIKAAVRNHPDAETSYRIACEILNPLAQDEISKALKGVLRGEIDADRMDYLLRDGTISGISFGRYDIERLIFSLELYKGQASNFKILPNIKGLSAIEAFFIERLKLYKWLYHHHSVVFFDSALESIFRLCLIPRAPLKTIAQEVINLERFKYENYRKESAPPTDDHFVICKFYDLYKHVVELLSSDIELKAWLQKHNEKLKEQGMEELKEIDNLRRLEWSKLLLESVLFRKKNHITLWKNKAEFDKVNNRAQEIAKLEMKKIPGADIAAIEGRDGPFYKNTEKLPAINYIKETYLKPRDNLREFAEFLWKDYTRAFVDSNYSIVFDRRKIVPLLTLAKGISDQEIVSEGSVRKLTERSTLMEDLSKYPGKEVELLAYLLKRDITKPPNKEEGQEEFAKGIVRWLCTKCEGFKRDYFGNFG